MPFLKHKARTIAVDDEGYLINFSDWDEDVARELAARADVGELTSESIAILKFIRDHFKTYNFFPIVGSICKNVREPKGCVTEKFINRLSHGRQPAFHIPMSLLSACSKQANLQGNGV